jgi:hypothetical protein
MIGCIFKVDASLPSLVSLNTHPSYLLASFIQALPQRHSYATLGKHIVELSAAQTSKHYLSIATHKPLELSMAGR